MAESCGKTLSFNLKAFLIKVSAFWQKKAFLEPALGLDVGVKTLPRKAIGEAYSARSNPKNSPPPLNRKNLASIFYPDSPFSPSLALHYSHNLFFFT